MQIGGFGFLQDYDKIRAAGFDFAELDMPELEQLSEKEFLLFRNHVEKCSLPVLNGARILPVKDPLIFVPGFQEATLAPYLEATCKRSAQIGIKKITFGNGKARWRINKYSNEQEIIFIHFLRMLCEIAGENNLEVLIEPLGPKYSNYINTLPEAAAIIERTNMPNLFTMADLRHLVGSEEPFEDITKYKDIIRHIHIDYPLSYPERKWPNIHDDYDYAPFFEQLKDYNETMTVEAEIPEDWVSASIAIQELLTT